MHLVDCGIFRATANRSIGQVSMIQRERESSGARAHRLRSAAKTSRGNITPAVCVS